MARLIAGIALAALVGLSSAGIAFATDPKPTGTVKPSPTNMTFTHQYDKSSATLN